ncbi:LLM class flavin-dependent oxidoreductase [Arenibacterium halophilum]|uniref:LLM class flavin-dependent oxidoreductase n=1 Tax=Arenibacterium halophilum TaxID=2583821 RepID=A0ABY2X972_9RHOB|nr:LLM class flavin-dependent oxidoreductase [Arenibacterium halophilum]TMV12932.1 LLM class flavin-dependent oxidoreductase [Arenibacterium halophilum]
MPRFSVLDLSPVSEGGSAATSLSNTVALARHAEALGFTRYWLAEHHNMPGIASAATSVVIGQVLAHTDRIRVGAGGIMLPNHAPLVIAEQFGTLATMYPDRVDLGLGRAPGTDGRTAWALRRNMSQQDDFPRDVVELMGFLGDPAPDQPVRAFPGAGTRVPVYILGSSLYGAELAAQLGLPYAFASHFAPAALDSAVQVYRQHFKPSAVLDAPYFMLAVNVFGAEDEATGRYLKSSMQLGFARLRSGQPGPLPRPVDNIADHVDPAMLRMVDQALSVSVSGPVDSVHRGITELIDRYAPDEIIFNGQIHDHAARLRSFEIAAEAMGRIAEPQSKTRERTHT